MKGAAGKLGDILAGVGKTAAVGVAAAGTALTVLTKQSLDAVGTYEQMVGGVNKIFEESAQKVIDFSHEAYKSAGLSANEYMEVVTSFSASLVASLKGDTEQAADLANMAIKDMSDNANVFGSDLASIQNAYTNFAKQNYTLLDNLKLGYGGTAREMARLLNESGVLGDNLIDLDDTKGLSAAINEAGFAKIIEAIHKTQERLNIIDTTKNEAFGTLEGSARAARAAWQNFLTGVGSPEQFSEQISVAISNISKNLHNIIPRLTEGLTELVDLLAPEIPPIIEETLPAIIQGSSTLLTGLAKRLPQLLTSILPSLAEGVVDVTTALVGVLPDLITSLKESIPIVLRTIWSKKDELAKAGEELIDTLIPSEPEDLINKAFDVLDSFLNAITSKQALDMFFDDEHGSVKIIGALADGLVEFSVNLGESAIIIIKNIGDYLNDEENRKQIFDSAKDIVINIGKGLTSQESKDALGGFVVESAKFIADVIVGGIDWDASGGEIARQIISGLYERLKEIIFLPASIAENIGNSLGEKIENNPLLNPQVTYAERDKTKFDPSQLVGLEMDAYNNAHKHSTGFLATRPTWLTNNIVGENGAEVLLPLENNTGWMDKLADKLGSKMNGSGVIYITINAPTGNADDIVNAIDEAFRNRQIAQDRSTGGTGWK